MSHSCLVCFSLAEVEGQRGYFPANFVAVIDQPATPPTTQEQAAVPATAADIDGPAVPAAAATSTIIGGTSFAADFDAPTATSESSVAAAEHTGGLQLQCPYHLPVHVSVHLAVNMSVHPSVHMS